MSFFDVSTYQGSHELRDSNHFITLLCLALIFVGSALNYLSYRETRFDLNALSICFLSAPVIFLASRANLLIFAYFLVSAYFFFVRNHTKHTHLLRMVTMVFLPVVNILSALFFDPLAIFETRSILLPLIYCSVLRRSCIVPTEG